MFVRELWRDILKTQFTFCVSHETPFVPEKLYDYAIGIGDYWPTRGAHVSALDPFWDRMRPVAYGAAGHYAIPRAIESDVPRTELTGVFTHRKIVIRKRASQDYYMHREMSISASLQLAVEDVRPWDGREFLIPSPLEFPQGVVRQYVEGCYAIDLFEYLSIAVKIGVMSTDQVQEFALETALVPGGSELGIYPTPWLYATQKKLAAVGREFVTRYGERISTYDPIQVRAVSFLAERLGSYFLLKELRARYPECLPPDIFGDLCVIVPDGAHYSPAIVGNRSDLSSWSKRGLSRPREGPSSDRCCTAP